MVLVIVIISYIFIIGFDYIPLIKSQNKKETIIYSTLLALSFVTLVLVVIGVKLPSPTKLIEYLLKSIIKT
ncbi:MAG: hypothetical protein PHW32_00725 [Bacilli bacterium]|nr:hypothetical protein [Bacilli bacterium]MDD4282172.1 hypothetical protein [Bacilli bacterium]MDD4718549.1 hypothetical protein [Bacilli bacterium]